MKMTNIDSSQHVLTGIKFSKYTIPIESSPNAEFLLIGNKVLGKLTIYGYDEEIIGMFAKCLINSLYEYRGIKTLGLVKRILTDMEKKYEDITVDLVELL